MLNKFALKTKSDGVAKTLEGRIRSQNYLDRVEKWTKIK